MANTKSAAKSARQNVRRRKINAGVITGIKTEQKKFQTVLSEGKADVVREEFSRLTSVLDKAVKRGVIHRNVADRRKSRLGKALARTKG